MIIVNRRIIDAVKSLSLPKGEYAVFGSALLDVVGIRTCSDIDLIVTRSMYKQLLRDGWSHFKYPNGDDGIRNSDGDIEAFFYCNTIPGHDEQSISGYISRAIDIEGVSFTSLIDMMKWKKAFGRKKDLRDIELIKNFLEQEAK